MSTMSPEVLAQKGETIYNQKFKKDFEERYRGKFVAIDVVSERAVIADTPEDALKKAQDESPNGFYHLIKVGSDGIYRLGYTSEKRGDWLFRQRRAVH